MLNLLEISSSNQNNERFNRHYFSDMSYLCSHFNRTLKLLFSSPMEMIIILQSGQVNSSLHSQESISKAKFHFSISPKTVWKTLLWVPPSVHDLSHFMSEKRVPSLVQFGCHNTAPGSSLWPRLSSYLYTCNKKYLFGSWRKLKWGIWHFKQSGGKWLSRISACWSDVEMTVNPYKRKGHKGRQYIYIHVVWKSLHLIKERKIYLYFLDLNNYYSELFTE